MNHNEDDLSLLKKCLYYRSTHRGMKELDILLGGFAEVSLAGLCARECALFSMLLDLHEPVLWAYFLTSACDDDQPHDSMKFLSGTSLETKLSHYVSDSNHARAS